MIKRLLLVLTLAASPTLATVTQIVGTLVDASGTPVNGTACFKLPVNAVDTSTSRALSPRPVCFPVTNGTFPAFATVVPNDVIQPFNTYYQVRVVDNSGSTVFSANYVVLTGGGTFNIGAAIPTNVLTTNVSYTGIALLSAGNNAFSGSLTATAFISASANPAGTGVVRLASQEQIVSRDFANTANVPLIWLDSQNLVELGNASFPPVIIGSSLFTSGSLTILPVSSGTPSNGAGYTLLAGNGTGIGSHTGGTITLSPGSGNNGGANGTVTMAAGFLYYPPAFAFASLGTPANGALVYCSNCTIANPCAGAGTGAMAKRLNGVWVCN